MVCIGLIIVFVAGLLLPGSDRFAVRILVHVNDGQIQFWDCGLVALCILEADHGARASNLSILREPILCEKFIILRL